MMFSRPILTRRSPKERSKNTIILIASITTKTAQNVAIMVIDCPTPP